MALTKDELFQAYGLFCLAANHVKEAEKYARALARLRGNEEGSQGYIDDLLWGNYGVDATISLPEFIDALKTEGVHISED